MVKLNVNPTRMELKKLIAQLSTATRGHKLLKDKQDELMRQFIQLVRKNDQLRKKLEPQMVVAMQNFTLASMSMPEATVENLLIAPTNEVSLDVVSKNVMSVEVPRFNFSYEEELTQKNLDYGFLQSTVEFDQAIVQFSKCTKALFELIEVEKTCQLLATEIEKTRRRVNALEYMTIPQLEETIRYIRMKLEENERADITRLIKIKSMEK